METGTRAGIKESKNNHHNISLLIICPLHREIT
jgi:hypothetical protein